MENNINPHAEDPGKKPRPVEHDYEAHQHNPGPSPEAVKEKNDDKAATTMKWLIPIIIIILFIIYWIMF